MSYRDKCEQLYLENQELKDRLREAESVIEFYWDKCPINVMGEAFCGDNPSHQVAQDYFNKYKTNE
jgi:hypothetical protein